MDPRQQKKLDNWTIARAEKIKATMEFCLDHKSITGMTAQLNNLHLSTLFDNGYRLNPLTDTYEKE